MLTGRQIRIARSLVGWSANELATRSELNSSVVEQAERYPLKPAITEADQMAIERALEAAGVEFIPENGDGNGARLKKGLAQ